MTDAKAALVASLRATYTEVANFVDNELEDMFTDNEKMIVDINPRKVIQSALGVQYKRGINEDVFESNLRALNIILLDEGYDVEGSQEKMSIGLVF